MVQIPAEFDPSFWEKNNGTMVLTCLLPNGVMILLTSPDNATLADIKEDLWEEAADYPFYGKLHDMSVYSFACINSMAEREELLDETRRIKDIRPTAAVLIISELSANTLDDQSTNVQIGHLIGKRLVEFDVLNNSEINDFRFKMRKLGDDIAQNRNKMTWQEKLFYQFPPILSTSSLIYRETLASKKKINIASKFAFENKEEKSENSEMMQSSHTFHVLPNIRPNELLEMILNKKAYILNFKRNEQVNDYVLKVCGQDDYVIGDNPIIQYQYIQDSISRDIVPTLVTVHKDSIPVKQANDYETVDFPKKGTNTNTLTLNKKKKYKSSWSVTEKFKITVCTISNSDPKKITEINIQAGLFYGGKSLCQLKKTEDKFINDKDECEFNNELEFDIAVCNIPRNAKLCFVLSEVNVYNKGTKTRKLKEPSKENPIAWANTTVYDFKNQLKSGDDTLYMWTDAEDLLSDDVLHPLGTVVSNPNIKYSTALTLKFHSYGDEPNQYIFPPIESVVEYAEQHCNVDTTVLSQIDIQSCKKLLSESDNLFEIHDQERKNIWSLREYWLKNAPDFLPKLLMCIDWDKREEVAEASLMLKKWPQLPVEKSLELLDYAYADQEVRSFAVQCLHEVSDEDLLLYLLQLVQAIKHELYLECDLVNFLIRRALYNQKIGHYLFWHLRSEMQFPAVSLRFGLILEAYCRGTQEHMPFLQRQVELLEKFKKGSELVRQRKDKDKAKAALKEHLSESNSLEAIRSPLDPSYRCSKIRVDKCKIMDSKMRPLWIVFENSDVYGEDIYVIFKNGDDLRQDMLTLQMLRIMDRLWKREGLDLRMNPYNCISMEHHVGMIEVVLNAETIANIQKKKGTFKATSAFKKGTILAWLRENNTTEAALNKAINEFTLSCAGYCVATYVLGIADRHSDNIMIKKSGQLFHIDFGHILGHFKEKFGFKRERVPFVLTHDFVNVINKGQKTAIEFKLFQEYCENAFKILRKHGNLILSLCAMMISTGLPELSSEKDLNYLRETLVLSKTEEEALNHFRCKFDEALSNSWKTSINWATHNIAKNNKA